MFGDNYEKERREIYQKREASEEFLSRFCKIADECLKMKRLSKEDSAILERLKANCKDENAVYSRCITETGDAYFKKMVTIEDDFSRLTQALVWDATRLKDALVSQKKNENWGNCHTLLVGMTEQINSWIKDREYRREQQMSQIKDQVVKAIELTIEDMQTMSKWMAETNLSASEKTKIAAREKTAVEKLTAISEKLKNSNVLDTDAGEKIAKDVTARIEKLRRIYSKVNRGLEFAECLEDFEKAALSLAKNASGQAKDNVKVFKGYSVVALDSLNQCDELSLVSYVAKGKAFAEEFAETVNNENPYADFDWDAGTGLDQNPEYTKCMDAITRCTATIVELKPKYKTEKNPLVRKNLELQLLNAKALKERAEARANQLLSSIKPRQVDEARIAARKKVQEKFLSVFNNVFQGDLSIKMQAELMLAYGFHNLADLYEQYKEAQVSNDEATAMKIIRNLDMVNSECTKYVKEVNSGALSDVERMLYGETAEERRAREEQEAMRSEREKASDMSWLDDEEYASDSADMSWLDDEETPAQETEPKAPATEAPVTDGTVAEVNTEEYASLQEDEEDEAMAMLKRLRQSSEN